MLRSRRPPSLRGAVMNRTGDTAHPLRRRQNQRTNLPGAIPGAMFPESLPINIPFASHDEKKNENIRKLDFLFYDVAIQMEAEI